MRGYLKGMAIAASVFLFGCSSDDSGSGGSKKPIAAELIAPINNSECISGIAVSETTSKVTLEWNASENTTNYTVYVKNLLTQAASQQLNAGGATTLEVTLQKNVPYSWYVVSKNDNSDTTPSATWKFYNAGNGVVNYAPFPAEIVAPAMSSSLQGPTVTIQWEGADPDNDIVEYKVYLDGNTNPTTLISTTAQQTLANVAIASNTTYYWKVVTKDSAGNTSTSPIFQFKSL